MDQDEIAQDEEIRALDELLTNARALAYTSLLTDEERAEIRKVQLRLAARVRELDMDNSLS